jgi:hypothetical protein
LDNLAPLLSFGDDVLAEIGRRARQRRAAQLGKPRLDFGIEQSGIDSSCSPNCEPADRVTPS